MAEPSKWNIGLMNDNSSKYLTAETFGFKLNSDGVSLRKKQTWSLEQVDGEAIYLKSHLGRYLTADPKGNLCCEAEERESNAKFTVEIKDGKWALKSVHGAYFGANGDQLKCVAKIGKTELWTVHLAMHPQINLKSVLRKRYAHLDEEDNDVKVSELIPWGADATITLKFSGGRYFLVTSNGKYVSASGDLQDEPNDDCSFSVEFHQTSIAFRDHKGKYLTAVGTGKLQSKKETAGKDELFQLEDSHPQVSFIGHTNKRVSIKQHTDLRANQMDMGDTEIFQLEFSEDGKTVSLLGNNGMYWVANGPVSATEKTITPKAQFTMEYHNNQVAFKAHTGMYLTSNKQGQLLDGTPELEEAGKFSMEIVNRPLLILKGEFGFIGCKTSTNRLECNRAAYDVFTLEVEEAESEEERGTWYKIGSEKGKYWRVEGDGSISVSGEANSADLFEIFLERRNYLCIKAKNGAYLRGQQNGVFNANGKSIAKDSLWEY
ncbi:predicted protein [Nematostella vectensis]|uniref:Fascin n=1 Tax=Nematostella vectensis TaxID=45351 RepID=A7RUD3_NEMVE|nr:predicted protein [Nematostella vectensis]|eukprot:XP_001636897.1 predicted protein [Nematostella vectensis]